MKKFMAAFIAAFIILFIPPGLAEDKEFVAVYSMPGTYHFWRNQHPDLYFISGNWDDFPVFLYYVKKESHGKKVVIDIDCHGDMGYMWNQYVGGYNNFISHQASLGYVCNEIDKVLPPKKVTLLLEVCHPQQVYIRLHDNITIHNLGDDMEPYHLDTAPPYPIWGVGSGYGYGNLIYLERKYHVAPGLEDLRQWEGKLIPEQDMDLNSFNNKVCEETFRILMMYGQ